MTRKKFLMGLAIGPAAFGAESDLFIYRDNRGAAHAIRTRKDWARQRARILDSMQQVMGPLPRGDRSVPEVVVLEQATPPKYVRKKITYLSEHRDRVPAYLFIPTSRSEKVAAVLCLHQTTPIGNAEPAGLGGKPNLHYAAELAELGYVTLAPDYPNFGEYTFDPYASGYASATMKGIWNHRRAVDLLASLPEVDRRRIGVIGHSLGGHNALFAAAFDERLIAVVSSCGFTSFAKYKGGNLAGWSHRGYMPRITSVYGGDPARMPFDFSGVLAAIAPRAVFINAPIHDGNFEVSGVDDSVHSALGVYSRIFARPDALVVQHPDAEHDFPPQVRRASYDFLDRYLKPR
jgi:dienelactone hydrolase